MTTTTQNFIITVEPVTKEGVAGKVHRVICRRSGKVVLQFWFADEYVVKNKVKQLSLL